jgi:hypothetical protein
MMIFMERPEVGVVRERVAMGEQISAFVVLSEVKDLTERPASLLLA